MTPWDAAGVVVVLVDFDALGRWPVVGEGGHFGDDAFTVSEGVAVFLEGEFEVDDDGAVDLLCRDGVSYLEAMDDRQELDADLFATLAHG